jgi:hypothetical protein
MLNHFHTNYFLSAHENIAFSYPCPNDNACQSCERGWEAVPLD